jgi:hypothetical protein
VNFLEIAKTAGTALLATHPAGAAAMTLINSFLPSDKKLGTNATGDDARTAFSQLGPKDMMHIQTAKIDQAVEEDKGRTARYVAMCESDNQSTRAKLVQWAMVALIAISVIFIGAVAWVYIKEGAAMAFSSEMAFVFITVSGTFAYVVRAYFGDLRTETESRHSSIDDKPRLAKGLAGLVQAFKAK